MAEYSVVGKSVPRVDGLDKVTGKAVFSTDIQPSGLLIGKVKRSPYPFARILSIDTDKARKLPGVKAVITAKDVKQCLYGPIVPDEFPLADEYARYAGDGVAAVAAVDEKTAEEALDLIEIEYEELTPVLDPEKAMEPGAPAVHPERKDVERNVTAHLEFERGKGEAAFEEADVIVEGRFSTQLQYQAYLEPQACVSQWDIKGKLTLWGSTQTPFRTRRLLAVALGIPDHQIRIIQPYVGGGFGGKTYLHAHFPISALLSKKAAGRPVKIVLTREEDFIAGRPRVAEINKLRMGFKKDGTIVAKSVLMTAEAGAYTGASPTIVMTSLLRPDCVYRQTNLKAVANLVYTNKIPRSPFRGYGNPEMLFAQESLMDMAAEKLGIDPMELRLKNASQKGDITIHGWILNTCGLSDGIKIAAEKSDWKNKKKNKQKNRGLGIALQVHVSGQRAMHPVYDGSAAFVHIDQFGKAKVISAESEMGQGMLTVFTQIAAEELGFAFEDVEVLPYVDTDVSPFGHGTSASRGTTLGGNGVRKAARDAREQLVKHAADKLGVNADDLEIKNSEFFKKGSSEKIATVQEVTSDVILRKLAGMPITGRGEYFVPDYVVLPDKDTKYGNYSLGYAYSAQIAEVEVDPRTGKVNVLDVWVGEDIGKVINPKMCEGQVEGGVVQGMGYALMEEYFWKDGVVRNPNFRDYKIPTFVGTPRVHCHWIETDEPAGPFGGKSIGEAAMNPTAVAIANAVTDAIGVRIKDLPLTSEKVLKALKEKKG